MSRCQSIYGVFWDTAHFPKLYIICGAAFSWNKKLVNCKVWAKISRWYKWMRFGTRGCDSAGVDATEKRGAEGSNWK
jgi:hypothetical protein